MSTPITATGRPSLSSGLPRDSATARQFFDPGLQAAWIAQQNQPYDFLVQSPTWKIGAVSISILRRQFDKTYVAAAFDQQRPRGHAEFHPRQRSRRLGDLGRREPARFLAHVSRAVQKLREPDLSIGAGPRIRVALAGAQPAGGRVIEAFADPVAEGRLRRRAHSCAAAARPSAGSPAPRSSAVAAVAAAAG